MTEKNYAQSIAGDLFRMIESAKEQGVGVDKGFPQPGHVEPRHVPDLSFLKTSPIC